MATSRSAGSKVASVVPIEASTRPQLGSLPKTAALKRLLRATLRPTSTASSSVAAFRVVIAISWSAPSASASSCIARSVQARVSAAVKSSADGVMPLAPLARTVTVSLVDMQPSESSRSKLTRVAARSAASRSAAGTTASVVSTTSMVASWGASMPAPLAMPADAPAGPLDDDLLADRVGGHDGGGRVGAAGRVEGVVRRVDAGQDLVAVVDEPDQAGGADDDVEGADAEVVGDPLGDGVGGLEAVGAGVAVGAAGVEHDRADDAVPDDLLAPQHRVGLAAVGGEDAGGVVARAVVDDQRDVLGAGRLEPGRDAGRAEALGGGDAHGAIPTVVRPGGLVEPERRG